MAEADADVEVYLHLADLPAKEVQDFVKQALELAQAVRRPDLRAFFVGVARLGLTELLRRKAEPDEPGRPVAIRLPEGVARHGVALLEKMDRARRLPGRQHARDN